METSQVVSSLKEIVGKIKPILTSVAEQLSKFLNINVDNVYLMLLFIISLFISSLIIRDKLSWKFWLLGIGLFFLSKQAGL